MRIICDFDCVDCMCMNEGIKEIESGVQRNIPTQLYFNMTEDFWYPIFDATIFVRIIERGFV